MSWLAVLGLGRIARCGLRRRWTRRDLSRNQRGARRRWSASTWVVRTVDVKQRDGTDERVHALLVAVVAARADLELAACLCIGTAAVTPQHSIHGVDG